MICDLAETYGIYDYEEFPVTKIAILVCGLRPESRIRQEVAKERLTTSETLLAGIFDNLNNIAFMLTGKKRGRPESLLSKIKGYEEKSDKKITSFESSNDFEQTRTSLLDKIERRQYGW